MFPGRQLYVCLTFSRFRSSIGWLPPWSPFTTSASCEKPGWIGKPIKCGILKRLQQCSDYKPSGPAMVINIRCLIPMTEFVIRTDEAEAWILPFDNDQMGNGWIWRSASSTLPLLHCLFINLWVSVCVTNGGHVDIKQNRGCIFPHVALGYFAIIMALFLYFLSLVLFLHGI